MPAKGFLNFEQKERLQILVRSHDSPRPSRTRPDSITSLMMVRPMKRLLTLFVAGIEL